MASRTDLLLLAELAGCAVPGPDPSDTDVPADSAPPAHEADTADPCRLLTWETAAAPLVRTWCTPCHASALRGDQRAGAPAGTDLDDAGDVIALAERVLARATGSAPTMPPLGGPSAEARERLAAWIACEVE